MSQLETSLLLPKYCAKPPKSCTLKMKLPQLIRKGYQACHFLDHHATQSSSRLSSSVPYRGSCKVEVESLKGE